MDAATASIGQGKQDPSAGDGATSSLKDRIARDLGQRILAGTYAQHALLPTEAELCVIYGASRTVNRDAENLQRWMRESTGDSPPKPQREKVTT